MPVAKKLQGIIACGFTQKTQHNSNFMEESYRVLHHTVYKVTVLQRKNEVYGIKFETNFIITIDEEFH